MAQRRTPHPLRTLGRIVRDVNTENDGRSWCAVRVAGSYLLIPAIPVFLWGVIYNTLQQHHFDFTGFAWGLGGLSSTIIALATGVNLKARVDNLPPAPPLPPPTGDGQ